MKKVFGIMAVIGLVLLCLAGYLAYTTYSFQQNALHAEGEVTDLRYSRSDSSSSPVWYPEITFVDEAGKTVIFESSVGSSSYRNSLGKTVEVIYRQGEAAQARINDATGLYFAPAFSGIFGIVLLLIGAVGYGLLNKGHKHHRLIHTGKPVTAKIVGVEINEAIEFNGRSPWRIVCQWLDPSSNQVYLFNSANFYYDPSPYINDETITVYVAQDNFKKYYVDVSSFPKKA
ncbi:DUF3592 domain-containing protein [Serratia sp. NPDC078593]|uniref:DUF3592 domain-containing protein n=1 Tax=unclassified Serratia (in: enterobacteria) TaxID=2647522 RepID=UPI0037CD4464